MRLRKDTSAGAIGEGQSGQVLLADGWTFRVPAVCGSHSSGSASPAGEGTPDGLFPAGGEGPGQALPVDVGNTTGWTRQGRLEAGGVDTLHATAYGHWPAEKWESTRALLEAKVEESKAARKEGRRVATVVLQIEGKPVRFAVLPYSVRKGSSDKAPNCKYVLEGDGMWLGIIDRAEYWDKRPNVFIELGSLACMVYGGRRAWGRALAALGSLGFKYSRSGVPGRVDTAVDVVEPIRTFWLKHNMEQYVTRGTSEAQYHEKYEPTGYTVGRGNIALRVYDKAAEIEDAGDDPVARLKYEYLVANRWGFRPKRGQVSRCEWQLRRSTLAEYGVRSVEDCFGKLGSIIAILNGGWYRLTVAAVDRANRHQDRAEVSALWKAVAAQFAAVFGSGKVQKVAKALGLPDNLQKQAAGCVAGILARVGFEPETLEECRAAAVALVDALASRVFERTQEKAAELLRRIPEAVGFRRGSSSVLECLQPLLQVRMAEADIPF